MGKKTFRKNKYFPLVDTDVTNLTKLVLYFYHFFLDLLDNLQVFAETIKIPNATTGLTG